MNNQRLEKKLRQDTAKVKKDLDALVRDSAARFSKFEDNVNQVTGKAKENINTWMEDGASQLSEGFEKLTDDAKDAAAAVKKDVGHGLSQYNAKAQEIADRVPGGYGKKAAKYPWVTITLSLVVGLLLGSLLRPARQLRG